MAYVISCARLFLAAAAAAATNEWAAAAAAAALAAVMVSMAPPWRRYGHPSIYLLQRSQRRSEDICAAVSPAWQ